ncbi:SAP30-binding protein isoform X2 [Heliangelus exortis]|uniref:SAP30-binding protein isoform X2 n=1 Tax=Heliangelus exortis TaxID=472823 RepID=UPI003A8CB854
MTSQQLLKGPATSGARTFYPSSPSLTRTSLLLDEGSSPPALRALPELSRCAVGPRKAGGGRCCYGDRAVASPPCAGRPLLGGGKMAAAKRSVLSSLAVYAEDSDPESDSEAGTAGSDGGAATGEKGGLVSVAYGDDDFTRVDGDEEGYEEEDDDNSRQSEFSEVEKRDPQELVASFSERVRNMSPDEIKIPPEPPGRCSNHLQDKIQKLYERKIKEGMDMNYIIQRKKEFRNPSIYEKLIQFCSIDELGTNYPKDMFDPHGWSEDSYYEALAKAQKIEMDKLEKAKKERTKIEFVTGTKKGTTTSATSTTTTTASTTVGDAQKRKSKWDSAIPVTTIAQPTILTTTATLPGVVTVTTSASGSKTTVISAVGTIVKKAKQ